MIKNKKNRMYDERFRMLSKRSLRNGLIICVFQVVKTKEKKSNLLKLKCRGFRLAICVMSVNWASKGELGSHLY